MPKRYTLRGREWHILAPGLRAIELGRYGYREALTLLETSDDGAVSCVVVKRELDDLADHDMVCEAGFQSNRCPRICDLAEGHEGPHSQTMSVREPGSGHVERMAFVDDNPPVVGIMTSMGPVAACQAVWTDNGDQQRVCEDVRGHEGPHRATKAVRYMTPEQIQADLAPPPSTAERVAEALGLAQALERWPEADYYTLRREEGARLLAERDEARAVATDLNLKLGAAERERDQAREIATSTAEELIEVRATIEGCGLIARGAQEALLGALAALGAQAAAWKAVADREPGATATQREALAWNETANRAILRAKASQGWK